jgi:hypothetical protein
MKILLTGMASSHTSKKVHDKNLGFFGMLHNALVSDGHEVEFAAPSIAWNEEYLEQYDTIFMGVVPPTSVTANRVYGALSVIEKTFNSSKLRLVVDSPNHWMLEPSLASVLREPQSLFKSFYSKRSEYSAANNPEVLARLIRACNFLSSSEWPITIYPSLPWKTDESVTDNLPSGAEKVIIGLNFDAAYDKQEFDKEAETSNVWLTNSPKSKWVSLVSKNIHLPIKPIRTSKKDSDSESLDTIKNSLAVLVAPQDRVGGSWWSPIYIQALNTYKPIATEWREMVGFSTDWAYLPSQIEEMLGSDRLQLALSQREVYLDSISTTEETLQTLNNLLNR